MNPYYQDEWVTLYHGDCRELVGDWLDAFVPLNHREVAVVTDPPYGMKWDTRTARFSGGSVASTAKRGQGRADWGTVRGDAVPFDPALWLLFPEVVLWGANHYAQRLPVGTTLVWVKRLDAAFGSFLSDGEVGWMKGGHGVYCFRDISMTAEARTRLHPTQKPVGLMTWCISKTTRSSILDPYAGSGTTLVAAKALGRKAIGIEIEERYCEIAARRLSQEVLDFGQHSESTTGGM